MNNTINILPCLQETATARKFVRAVGYGKENTPGYIDRTGEMREMGKEEFVQRWLGGSGKLDDDIVTKGGVLTIPKCLQKYNCKTSQDYRRKLWTDLFNVMINSYKNVFLLSSHTMRMVGNLVLTPNCNYYNNCACVLVDINVDLDGEGEKIVNVTQTVVDEGTGGKKKKKSCKFKNVRDVLLEKILLNMDLPSKLNYQVFIVRHGNGIHNKPINVKQFDSSLTPLGVYQAYNLGKKLGTNYFDSYYLEDIYLGASFLRRTQHTILGVLKGIYDDLEPQLEGLYRQFNSETLRRCGELMGEQFNNLTGNVMSLKPIRNHYYNDISSISSLPKIRDTNEESLIVRILEFMDVEENKIDILEPFDLGIAGKKLKKKSQKRKKGNKPSVKGNKPSVKGNKPSVKGSRHKKKGKQTKKNKN